MDNVRVGPEAAVIDMSRLQGGKVPSFPVYVGGWYLNAGIFSSETAAKADQKRLATLGVATTIIQG